MKSRLWDCWADEWRREGDAGCEANEKGGNEANCEDSGFLGQQAVVPLMNIFLEGRCCVAWS